MARKIIDIGAIGNDGTGDSIRDSFRKVNDNFRELYSSLGLGERLQFIGLDDTPETYNGQENAILTVNSTEEGVAFRRLVAGSGIQIDLSSNENEIAITNLLSDISGDPRPNLGGPLNAESGTIKHPIGNMVDISDVGELAAARSSMQAAHGLTASNSDRLAVNKRYADTKISLAGVDAIDPATGVPDTRFGKMTGPLILSRNPVPEDDLTYDGLVAATKRYVDNSGFGSGVNLYVATTGQDDRENLDRRLQGRALPYAYRTVEAALKKAEEILLDAPIEIGPYKKVLTYGDGEFQCYLQDIDFTNGVPLNPATFDLFMSADNIEIESGGNLYLPGDKLTLVGGTFNEPIKLQVLTVTVVAGTGGRGPVSTFRLLTSGVYSVLPGSSAIATTATSVTGGSTFGSGATFNLTYKVNNIQVGNSGGSGYGLVSVTFQGGGGGTGAAAKANVIGGVIQGVTVINKGSGYTAKPNIVASLPRFFIFTGGQRTDFTGSLVSSPQALRTRDIREGLLLRGETSGAIAQILAHTGSLSTVTGFEQSEIFDVDILQGEFIEGEIIAYGDVTKPTQICVFVEAGIYEENFPLKLPQNVALIGDEFRRTLIRPRSAKPNAPLSAMSSSPWAFINFRRDPEIDGITLTEQVYGYHYLSDPTIPVYPLLNNSGSRRAAAEILDLNREFIKYQVIGWINNQISTNTAPFTSSFDYDQDLCRRDVGLIIDAINFDLKYGGYARTISAALKYFQSVSALIAIGPQLSQTLASIARIDTLAQDIISNNQITDLYTPEGQSFDPTDIDNTLFAPFEQIVDLAYVAEPGSSTVITDLIDIMLDILQNSGSANYPKDNDRMDMFLCNDANIIRAVTGQGQGGFMMVLDPEGQVLTKSPYCQESASFSRSTGLKTFAGGMFVDGFTGNQRFFIESTEPAGDPPVAGLIINISGLLRPPQTPCSFIVSDVIYRVNYIRNYNYGIIDPSDPGATTEGGYGTAQLILDETTPYNDAFADINCTFSLSLGDLVITVLGGHGLQIRAIIQFKTTGTLPDGIEPFKDYYVIGANFTENQFKIADVFGETTPIQSTTTGTGTASFRRVFEILMPGNRSMLSNDYTQVNDLGYGLMVANGGLTEAVSMFTYYCQVAYFALTGGQIRSVGGSSAHGNFALVAKGSDPLEVPTPVGLYHKLSAGASIYATGIGYVNNRGDQFLYVNYDDYLPLPGSEIEINHGNIITRYAVNSLQVDDLATKRTRVNISSSGGLEYAIPHGQRVTIRQNSFIVLTGDIVDVATRPSTALVLNESPNVYRVLEFNDYDTIYDKDDVSILSINTGTGLITTDKPHRQILNYTIKFEKISGTLPNIIVADEEGPPTVEGEVYYIIADGLTANTFKISLSPEGSALDLSGGGSYTGVTKLRPFGLGLTQLRENYQYLFLDLFRYQPFQTPGSLTNGTVDTSNDWITTASTFPIHTQISFTATTMPNELQEERFYWVISDSFSTNTRFAIAQTPPIFHSQIGVGTYNPVTQRITGLRSTANMTEGMQLISVPSITSVSASAIGTAVTLTFSARPKPPFILGQQVTVSGFGVGAYNGTFTITGVTTTTLNYTAATAPAGSSTGGTIALPSAGYGTLPTNATIAAGGIISATEIAITGTSGSPAAGTVAFNVEGIRINFTTAGSNVKFGKLIGDQGTTQVAITTLPATLETRVTNSVLVFEGTEYQITNYTKNPGGLLYSLITLNTPLVISAISFLSPISLKSGVAVPSNGSLGTLTIRIALVRVTSHDFLEIGTGSYADTNYPNDIFGAAVNDFNTVALYQTDTDSGGEAITRAQVQERDVGRCFFVTTDQYGNFSVGPFFKVDQGTGTVTFSASIALSQLDGLGFKRGATISEFSTDDRMQDEANDTVPTEAAVASFISRRLGTDRNGNAVLNTNLIPALTGGFLALAGNLPMKGNIDMATFRVRNLGVPSLLTDAARLDSINITNLKDTDGTDLFEFTEVRAGQLVAMKGDRNVMSNFTPTGDVVFDIDTGDSAISVIRTAISPGVIINADVNASAGIVQSKLSMNAATTRANATGIAQADRGLASFDNAQFDATNGWISLKNNGITLGKIAQIGSDTVLGNSTGANANVTAVAFTTVVDEGGAVKKSQYSSGVGYLKRTNATVGNHTADSHYSIVNDSAAATASTLVIRDANADFAGRYITADQFVLKTPTTGNYKALEANEATTTTGFTNVFGYGGGGGSVFAGIQIGAGTSNNRTLYNNDSHILRSQDGNTVYATLTSTGLTVGAAGSLQAITASSLTATAISAGAEATAGTVTGRWTLVGTSRWQATYAADLAEFYEGDREYEVGTVLIFGGGKEVTESTQKADTKVAGVVSDTAAYSMYGACPGFKNQIALQGRVPCKVKGKVRKGDLLVTSDIAGVAESAGDTAKPGTIIGKAIEDYDSDQVGTITVSVGRT